MYIAIAGNIGAGKTTLTKMLARYYGWEPRFESVSFNPYLEDYYTDINRWAFCLETYFLKERFKDMLAVQQAAHTIVQDRSIFEGVHVFVRNNYEHKADRINNAIGILNGLQSSLDKNQNPELADRLLKIALYKKYENNVKCLHISQKIYIDLRRSDCGIFCIAFAAYRIDR
mgnify:CR=1 FL=1